MYVGKNINQIAFIKDNFLFNCANVMLNMNEKKKQKKYTLGLRFNRYERANGH